MFKSPTYRFLAGDFNNDLGADLIVALFWVLHLFKSNSNNDPPWATPSLCQMKYTSVQVSCLRFPGGCYIWPRAPCLISIIAQEII